MTVQESNFSTIENFPDVVDLSIGISGIPIYILVYVVIYLSAAVVGSIGNILVILTLIFTKVLRQSRNAFIVSLAVADFMVSFVTMPASVLGILVGKVWFDERFAMCSFTSTMCAPGCVASMHCIAWIAISRYYYIGQFAKYQKYFTSNRIAIYLAIIWVMSFGVHLPNRLGWGKVHYSFILRYCTLDTDDITYASFYATVLVSAIVAAFFFYFKIYGVLRNSTLSKKLILGTTATHGASVTAAAASHDSRDSDDDAGRERRQQQQQQESRRQQTAFSNEVKIIKTSFKIFILFFVTWLPICILLLLNAGDLVPPYVYLYAAMLAHCNSTLNFVVYFMENDLFRKSLKQLIFKMISKAGGNNRVAATSGFQNSIGKGKSAGHQDTRLSTKKF